MKRTRLYTFIIAALVIMNVVILIIFFTGGPGYRPPKSGDLAQKLGLEGEKKELVTSLEEAHHAKKGNLIKEDRRLHEQLFSKMGTGEDVADVQAQIKENYGEIEQETYAFFVEVSTYCTDEQKKELNKMIRGAFDHVKAPKGKSRK